MARKKGALLRRRRFLAALAGSGALTVTGLPLGQARSLAAASVSSRFLGPIVARQVDHPAPATLGAIDGSFLTSPVIEAEQLFDRIALHYGGARDAAHDVSLQVRVSPDGASWSAWRPCHADEYLTDPANGTHYVPPQAVRSDSRYAQYRVELGAVDPGALAIVAVTFLDVSDLNQPALARLADTLRGGVGDLARGMSEGSVAVAASGAPKILTRQDWGADEGLMQWTPRYVPVKKMVVHHTVTDDGGTNVAATIRSIYYYHAVTRGWGDIGYSYLVDKYGNIWTGRQGGDNVVAGHAYGWNDGTIGVASIGNYDATAPTGQLQGAIANIVALKMKQLGIAPYGSSPFTHQEQKSDGSWIDVTTTVANLLGHRDCNYIVGQTGGQTACPGGHLYGMLAGLRSQAQSAWQAGYVTLARLDPQLQGGGYPGQQLQALVGVANVGTTTIPKGTLVSYRLLSRGSVVMQGPGAALSQDVPPGGITTVQLPFVAPAAGGYVVRWDLMTGTQWWNTLYAQPVRDQWFRSADWSANWIKDNVTRQWTAGETRQITVTVQNDGGRTWNATGTDPVTLGYYWISTATGNRITGANFAPIPGDVLPGQTVTLTIGVTAPPYPTNYTMILDLYKQNEFWFRDKGLAPDDTPTTVATDFHASYQLAGALPAFSAGKSAVVPITILNIGKGVFPISSGNPIALGYHWYDAGGAALVWDGARTKLPADLAPGQSVTLQALVTAPAKGGQLSLRFDLVQEGVGWFSSKGVAPLALSANVVAPVFGATYRPDVSAFAQMGASVGIPITVTNTSNFTWAAGGPNPIDLGYHWADAGGKTVVWDGARTKLAVDLAPGQSAQLQASVVAPSAQGTYTLRWDMVQEGVTWFSGQGVRTFDQSVVVGPPPFYGGSIDVSKVPAKMSARMANVVPVRVQNMSNFSWGANVNLSYHWYDTSGNAVVWDGARTPLAGLDPNELASLNANVVGPQQPGTYVLKFDIVQEGVTWFSSKGMLLAPIVVTVQVPALGATYAAPAQVSGVVGATIAVPVTVTNVGGSTWQPGAINLGYHLYAASGNTYVWDGARTSLPQPLAPGQSVTLNAILRMPATSGAFTIRWDLVQEGVAWLSTVGVPPGSSSLIAQ